MPLVVGRRDHHQIEDAQVIADAGEGGIGDLNGGVDGDALRAGSFHIVIKEARYSASRQLLGSLWKEGLQSQLLFVKQFLLMGNGNVFSKFISLCSSMFSRR